MRPDGYVGRLDGSHDHGSMAALGDQTYDFAAT